MLSYCLTCRNVDARHDVQFVDRACSVVQTVVVQTVVVIVDSDHECIVVQTVVLLAVHMLVELDHECIVVQMVVVLVVQTDELQGYSFVLILLIAFLRMFDCLGYGIQTLVQSSESS